ncbi:MAG: hypothetical protein ACR2HX_03280 [Pyrinomonadaceae bacterium]
MLRFLLSGVLLIGCLATLTCQSYTTGLQQGSKRADEGTALATLQAITRAQAAYNISNPGDYGTFEQLAAGGYLDSRFNNSKPKFYGYVFTMSVSPKSDSREGSYGLNADPDPALKQSGRHFYIDSSSSEIHVNASQQASASDGKVEL